MLNISFFFMYIMIRTFVFVFLLCLLCVIFVVCVIVVCSFASMRLCVCDTLRWILLVLPFMYTQWSEPLRACFFVVVWLLSRIIFILCVHHCCVCLFGSMVLRVCCSALNNTFGVVSLSRAHNDQNLPACFLLWWLLLVIFYFVCHCCVCSFVPLCDFLCEYEIVLNIFGAVSHARTMIRTFVLISCYDCRVSYFSCVHERQYQKYSAQCNTHKKSQNAHRS